MARAGQVWVTAFPQSRSGEALLVGCTLQEQHPHLTRVTTIRARRSRPCTTSRARAKATSCTDKQNVSMKTSTRTPTPNAGRTRLEPA
eukprot:357906-Chlamydomonas_euryale.AAC.3